MKPKDLTSRDCSTIGFLTRKSAIWEANMLTRALDEQHRVIKLPDGLWYAYNATKHH
jgi:hypothetical protein